MGKSQKHRGNDDKAAPTLVRQSSINDFFEKPKLFTSFGNKGGKRPKLTDGKPKPKQPTEPLRGRVKTQSGQAVTVTPLKAKPKKSLFTRLPASRNEASPASCAVGMDTTAASAVERTPDVGFSSRPKKRGKLILKRKKSLDGSAPSPVVAGKTQIKRLFSVRGTSRLASEQGQHASPSDSSPTSASPLRRRPRLASPEKVESMEALEVRASQTSACSDDDILQGFDLEGFLSQVKGAPSPEKEAPPSKSPIRGPATLTRGPSLLVELVEDWDMSDGVDDALGTVDIAMAVKESSQLADSGRLLVLEITPAMYTSATSTMEHEQLVVRTLCEKRSVEMVCMLRDEWAGSSIESGDYIRVHGNFDVENRCIVDKEQNLVIINPDILVSGTKITESFMCPRKAILSSEYRSDGPFLLTRGTILHELLQAALAADDFTTAFLQDRVEKLLSSFLLEAYVAGQDMEELRKQLIQFVPSLQLWAQSFLKNPNGTKVNFKSLRNGLEAGHDVQQVSMFKLVDIEENYWCPRFGIKGVVDVSMEVKIHPRGRKRLSSQEKTRRLPFEIKTGKPSEHGTPSHRAQVILYTLMMGDRYGTQVDTGILHYMKSGQMCGVPVEKEDVKALIIARNELAHYIRSESGRLPDMLGTEALCRSCSYVDTCSVLHKALESGTAESSGMGSMFLKKTDQMTKQHIEYLALWEELINLEASSQVHDSKIWLEPSEREGRSVRSCVSGLQIESSSIEGSNFLYTFKMQSTEAKLSHLDMVVASTEDRQYLAFAKGTVSLIDDTTVVLNCSQSSFLLEEQLKNNANLLFRLDLDQSWYSNKTARTNLVKLFHNPEDYDPSKLRSMVVDLETPLFKDLDPLVDAQARERLEATTLNSDQKAAISKVLRARNYSLIQGMPGTGKTTTIVELVLILASLGKSVLLTSFTHSAVDTILLKLKGRLNCLRLGKKCKVRSELHCMLPELPDGATMETVQRIYFEPQVVATTCLGVTHQLFRKRRFDVCIVDEASQISQVICLGPLHLTDTFVLVGDHFQLPPLIQNQTARERGMDISLFKRLAEQHPQAVATLRQQYRMCDQIMSLSNQLIYNHRLVCGTQEVATRTMPIDIPAEFQSRLKPWLRTALDPSTQVVFLDTDQIPAREELTDNLVGNPVEVSIIVDLVTTMAKAQADVSGIGVVCPYRHQLRLLGSRLGDYQEQGLEMNTVDKYQGRDKECIIISLVRSNTEGRIGRLLQDWRRINVALTRARSKLVVVGSAQTCKTSPIMSELVDIAKANSWLVTIPPQ